MRILIIIFIFFSYYSSLNANEIFNLIKIPNLEVFNLDSKNKIKYLSLKKVLQSEQLKILLVIKQMKVISKKNMK